MRSFQLTPTPRRPCSSQRMVGGTWNQRVPVATAYAISEVPMPVPAAATAPYVVEWESVPTTSIPGRTNRVSTRSWWQMPCPVSKKCRIPNRSTPWRMRRCRLATAAEGGGEKWSNTTATRSGSQTRWIPSRSRVSKRVPAKMSWTRQKSTAQVTNSPARTGRPAARPKIASARVCPMAARPFGRIQGGPRGSRLQ